MLCPSCRTHFSASPAGGSCPDCGGKGEATPRLAAQEALAVAMPPDVERTTGRVSSAASLGGDETRTEGPASGRLRKGAIVAGKYEILQKIGSGGFGSVYKVRHTQRKKLYALKVPHAEYLRDATFGKRFEREIEVMERFVHPDMVVVRDSGLTDDGIPYYTMDFIEGESLRDVLLREGTLDIARAVNVIRRTLQVLEAAHRHQIIHRDIKPDNILLTREEGREVVKVLDFGIAKIVDPARSTGSITQGVRVGTPKYMSPEQITGEEVDARSDLFAVGILLYEALTGQHPFASPRDPIRTTAAILGKEPENPQKLRPDLPRALAEKVLLLLEKKPRRRPQSAAQALDLLPPIEAPRAAARARLGALRLCEHAPRRQVSALVLSFDTLQGKRRHFLFFKPRLTFGRSNVPERGIVNDLLLRRLPCRSAAEDPENWRLNLTMSHRVGAIGFERSSVIVEPAPGARGQLFIGGVRSSDTVRIQSDRFHLALGDHALALDGYRVLRDLRHEDADLSFLPALPGGAPVDTADIGYSNPECFIDCLRLARTDNHPLHEYHLVFRRLAVGSAAGADLRLPDAAGVAGQHALLLFDGGELFLLPVEDGVVVESAAPSAAVDPTAGRPRRRVAAGEILPVVEGQVLAFGALRLEVEALDEAFFKRP